MRTVARFLKINGYLLSYVNNEKVPEISHEKLHGWLTVTKHAVIKKVYRHFVHFHDLRYEIFLCGYF